MCFDVFLALPGIYVGQNMCVGSTSWEECIKQWYDEKNNFVYGFGTKTLSWMDIGHFTQVCKLYCINIDIFIAMVVTEDRNSLFWVG